MKPLHIKILILVLSLFIGNAHFAETTDIDWIQGSEPLYEAGPESPVIGTRWGLASRRDNVQITFRLEVSTDMKKGGWMGDIRAAEKFYSIFYLVDAQGNKNFVKLRNPHAVGPDSDRGIWKPGPATSKEQMLIYQLSWDELNEFKDAQDIAISYASFDDKDNYKTITFPMDSFKDKLNELAASVGSLEKGKKFVMTRHEIDNTPLKDLPSDILEKRTEDTEKAAKILGLSPSGVLEFSISEIQQKLNKKSSEEKAAKLAQIKKQHQAIYDQKPDWLDLNVCPKNNVSYCNDIGKTGFEKYPMFPNDVFKYGKILGVVWRPKDSIVRIYAGDVNRNSDPEIYRASEAEYYYIVKSDRGTLDIRPCDAVEAKN